MTTLIKKSQIATEEFIRNPQPSDPWNSTTDTASLAAIAAKIAGVGGCSVYYGAGAGNTWYPQYITLIDGEIFFNRGVPYCALLVIRFTEDIDDEDIYIYNPSDGSYQYFELTYKQQPITSGYIKSGDVCAILLESGVLKLISNDRWGAELASARREPYGVCQSALYATAMTVDADGFSLQDGATALVRFTNGILWQGSSVPTFTLDINNTGAKQISVWGTDWLVYGSTKLIGYDVTARVVYFEYYNKYYIVWTSADMSRLQDLKSEKQDSLPPYAGNAGKYLAVNNLATGLEWKQVNFVPQHTYHSTTVSANGATTTVTCTANERAFHSVFFDGVVGATLVINLQNEWDNTIYMAGPESDDVTVVIQIAGQPAIVEYESSQCFGQVGNALVAELSKFDQIKLVVEVVDSVAVVDVDYMEGFVPQVQS